MIIEAHDRIVRRVSLEETARLPTRITKADLGSITDGAIIPIKPLVLGNKAYDFVKFDSKAYRFDWIYRIELGPNVTPSPNEMPLGLIYYP